ncbi:hypothetical protein GCM10010313_35030 [Streptomyces violarus]|nr:hypothetical protein GCM10010313_35030 [Streptomyces violarus]
MPTVMVLPSLFDGRNCQAPTPTAARTSSPASIRMRTDRIGLALPRPFGPVEALVRMPHPFAAASPNHRLLTSGKGDLPTWERTYRWANRSGFTAFSQSAAQGDAQGMLSQACFDASSISVMSDGAPTRVGGPQAPAPRET